VLRRSASAGGLRRGDPVLCGPCVPPLGAAVPCGGREHKRDHLGGPCGQAGEGFRAGVLAEDHFGEYVHPEHGLVDSHGLSDVNWAAVAFGVATGKKLELVWARLMKEPAFWLGGLPTQNVTKPFSYEKWEINVQPECVGDALNDVAAMGRVWYLEAVACQRMKAYDRLVESARKVCQAAKADGYWR